MSAHSKAVADDQTDSQPASVAEEVAATRARALLLTTAEQVPYADAPSLLATQAVLQHGTTHGRWPYISVYHDFDVVGQFYGEFLTVCGLSAVPSRDHVPRSISLW